ncbi:MAG: DUF421 domain-containing protein [Planctomycetaceae bacterium]|nr:DUF421 domain-containing protein [Planctomycetaceae bacterium]
MLFDGWLGLVRTLVVGTLAYVILIVALRTSGKRTLSKMNAFDLVVTVALGSTLATVLLSKDVALAEGVLALALLILLQFLVTWMSVRVSAVRRVVKSGPTLLVFRGELIPAALRDQRVTEDEIRSAARGAGVLDLSDATAIVLETDGSFSVMRGSANKNSSSLADLTIPNGERKTERPEHQSRRRRTPPREAPQRRPLVIRHIDRRSRSHAFVPPWKTQTPATRKSNAISGTLHQRFQPRECRGICDQDGPIGPHRDATVPAHATASGHGLEWASRGRWSY